MFIIIFYYLMLLYYLFLLYFIILYYFDYFIYSFDRPKKTLGYYLCLNTQYTQNDMVLQFVKIV